MPRRTAFYPCCATDFEEPLALLSGLVDEVIFCDIDKKAEQMFAKTIGAKAIPGSMPTATFICDKPESAVARISEIDVLFYRRDSDGEGGSRLFVLGDSFLPKILERMPDKGSLIITDGSNSRGGNFERMTRASGLQKHGFRFAIAREQPFLISFGLHIVEAARTQQSKKSPLDD